MERRPGGARSLYLLHRVSEKPSSLCTEKAGPQVGFQFPSASGLGELVFCCGHRSVESWRCSVSARLHQAHSWAKLIKPAVTGQGPDRNLAEIWFEGYYIFLVPDRD